MPVSSRLLPPSALLLLRACQPPALPSPQGAAEPLRAAGVGGTAVAAASMAAVVPTPVASTAGAVLTRVASTVEAVATEVAATLLMPISWLTAVTSPTAVMVTVWWGTSLPV